MYDFKEIERQAGKILSKKDIQKAVRNDSKRKKVFSFLEGPPTANAPPALHHLEVRTYKDIINKFKYMQGFNVPRKAGWDCHGLPVEVQVEKQLKLNSKKDILKYGEAKFIQKSKESVFSYIKDWDESTKKLNYWIDLENPYRTLDNNYIESVWWSLKQLYDKKLLYESHKVVPFCPRCGTSLSSHEVAQGYKDITEDSVYIAFKLKNKKNEYILAWTTTPWTLPGNVALAVGKNIDYVKVKLEDGDTLILGKEKLDLIQGNPKNFSTKNFGAMKSKDFKGYKILKTFKGKKLEGLEYEPLFEIKETQNKNSHKVILADFVTTEDGTGVVHTAVMYGEDDYNVGTKKGLPAVHTVGEDGKFLEIVPKFAGIFVKNAEREIIDDLKERKLLFKTEKITHSYPFCWRCDSVLLYYAINSWFVKVSSMKKKLIELNKKINWVPKHIQEGRFGDWLENVRDWALSRSKFWGTPLPVWKCECGNQEIIGSIKELEKKSVKKLTKVDLHKPWIDSVKLKCSKCKKQMTRISDVIDCWYDSGAASFAQFHYPFENKKEFEKRFSYDFIAEAIDQTRGWFYTLHVLGALLFGKVAYKNVICAGHIVDENGEKMSKSKGNVLNPEKVLEEVGVDATRLQFCVTDIGSSKRFGINLVKESVLPFLNTLWNTFNYYKQLDNSKGKKVKVEDKWILSRLNSVVKETTEALESYHIEKGLKPIMDFVVNDFSKTYIKLIREREDKNVKKVVAEVLEKVAKLLAPYAPNMSEVIYQEFGTKNSSRNFGAQKSKDFSGKDKSIHFSTYPKFEKKKIDKKLEKEFESVLEIIEKGLAEREKIKMGLKWPLAKVEIHFDKKLNKKLLEIIEKQLNVKKIVVKQKAKLKVKFDEELTHELEAEGYGREISRKVQAFRKKLGLEKKDKIELMLFVDDNFEKILKKQEKMIRERTNSKKLKIVTTDKERFKNNIEFKIKDKKGMISIK